MKNVFKNKSNELRSGWKIAGVISTNAIFEMVASILFAIVGIACIAIINSGKGLSITQMDAELATLVKGSAYSALINNTISFGCTLLAIFIFLKFVDKKKFRDMGLLSMKSGCKELLYGLLFGTISISAIFFVLMATKNISVTNFKNPNFSKDVFIGLALFILVGIKEELLTRGYCITALNQMKKPWLSIILSSVIFSSMHLLNPNVKPLGLLNIVLIGVLFGYMFVKTNNLWMPIGYHIAWNYFQGCIYGFNVSGLNIKGLFSMNVLKDNVLTGGAFGPEAGILTTLVIATGMLVVWKMPKAEALQESTINENA